MAERYDLIPGTEYAVGRSKAVCQIAVRDQFTDVSRVHCAIKTFEDISGIGKIVKIRDLSNNGIAALNRNAKPRSGRSTRRVWWSFGRKRTNTISCWEGKMLRLRSA